MINRTVQILFHFFICVAFVIYGFFNANNNGYLSWQICIIVSFLEFLLQIYSIRNNIGKYLNPISIFLVSFYLFQNGQFLLYTLGLDFNTFYLNVAGDTLPKAAVFSSISNIVAGYAGVIISGNKASAKSSVIDTFNEDKIIHAVRFAFVGVSLIVIPLTFLKALVSIQGGYAGLRRFESTVPSIVNFIEYMFTPFLFLSIIYKCIPKKIDLVLGLLFFGTTALCGDRTTGVAGILLVIYMSNNANSENTNSFSWAKKYTIPVLVFGIVVLSVASHYIRNKVNFSFSSLIDGSVIVEFISEVGFTGYVLCVMMSIVPGKESFMLGKGYLLTGIAGAVPTFLDPTGLIREIYNQSRTYFNWISQYYSQYKFGLGYSMNSEAYVNFGWFGFIFIFLVCLFIFQFLRNSDSKNSKFNYYKTTILLFEWITLPRRDTYYVWNALVYCVLFVYIYLNLYCNGGKIYLRKRG